MSKYIHRIHLFSKLQVLDETAGPSQPVPEEAPEALGPITDIPMPVDPLPIPLPEATARTRPVRSTRNRLPARYRDFLPEGPTEMVHEPPSPVLHSLMAPETIALPALARPVVTARTAANRFGVFREYADKLPERDPDADASLDDLLVGGGEDLSNSESASPSENPYAPYPNRSSYLLGDWFWSGGNVKTRADMKHLVGTLQDPGFVNADLLQTNWDTVDVQLGDSGPDNIFKATDGWRRASVTIKVPIGTGREPKDFQVDGLFFRPIEEVVDVQFTKARASRFHLTPFKEYYQPPDAPDVPPERVYGEAYSSPDFEDIHTGLRDAPPADCNLPRAAAACMLWSDSTHLADFGTASLWPVYLMFGNESKYERAKSNSRSCHHIAYIPKVRYIHRLCTRLLIDIHILRRYMMVNWRLSFDSMVVAKTWQRSSRIAAAN